MRRLRWVLPVVIVVLAAGFLLTRSPGGGELLRSDKEHDTSPEVPPAEIGELIAGNTAFAFDLYHGLREQEGNLFLSPHSISIALAMTYAGARGETERQMADTLHFTLSQDSLHPAFNALGLELARRQRRGFEVHLVNAVWGQSGHPFLPSFLDTLAVDYDAGVRLVDFIREPTRARGVINDWVGRQTNGKIRDLVPPDLIHRLTRLVLTNAICFDAGWQHKFDAGNTRDGPFALLDGSVIEVPMMYQQEDFRCVEGEGFQAVELPYEGAAVAMVVLLPAEDGFRDFERSLAPERVQTIVGSLELGYVHLTMPKFEYVSRFRLKEPLSAMGMPDAFDCDAADFSGMTGKRDLWIDDVVHKAMVAMDERGTRAAAGTGVPLVTAAGIEITIDGPFIFLIRDMKTGTILFLGRVLDPRG